MNYKIFLPCLLIVALSIVGIYSFANDKQVEIDEEIIITHKEEPPKEQGYLPENHIILDMNKEQCKSGITKCTAILGCKEQC